MSSAFSVESGPIRRRAWRAATAPATMPTIQPMTTSRKIRVNMASSFSAGRRPPRTCQPTPVRPPESARQPRKQVLRLEAEQLLRPREIEGDRASTDRALEACRRVETGQEVGSLLRRVRVRPHDVDHVASGEVPLEGEGERPSRVTDV